jgi:hypothetical protein
MYLVYLACIMYLVKTKTVLRILIRTFFRKRILVFRNYHVLINYVGVNKGEKYRVDYLFMNKYKISCKK